MLYPDVQQRAYDELDSVVGNGRLPNMDDFSQLPYIRQITKESLRCKYTPCEPLSVLRFR